MTLKHVLAVGVPASLCLVTAAALFLNPRVERVGQILFVPGESLGHASHDTALGQLEIRSCRVRDDGLEVLGHVEPNGGVVHVLVAPADPRTFGVGVSVSEASDAGARAGAGLGDFRVIIPWARPGAAFAVTHSGERRGSSELRIGRVVTCPGVAG